MKWLAVIAIAVAAVVVMGGVAWYVLTASHPPGPSPSILNVSLHDLSSNGVSPFSSVIVNVSAVEVHQAGATNDTGWLSLALQTRSFDLVKLTSNVSALLGSGSIPPGNYTQVRVSVSSINATYASNLTKVGVYLYVDVLLTTHPFRVNSSDVVSYAIDLDLVRSFVAMPWGAWYFLPVLGPVVVSKA